MQHMNCVQIQQDARTAVGLFGGIEHSYCSLTLLGDGAVLLNLFASEMFQPRISEAVKL